MKTKSNVIPMPKLAPSLHDGLTDVYNSERFAHAFSGQLAYCPQRGQWMEYADHAWRVDEMRFITQKAIELTKSLLLDSAKMMMTAHQLTSADARALAVEEATKLAKHAIASQSKAKLDAMVAIAATVPCLAISQADLDKDDLLIGLQNGVYELESGQFRDGQPEDYITKQSQAEWLKSPSCKLWEQFLCEVQPDPEVRQWLQKFAGYCLTGLTGEQIFAIFQGSGANGKSVFVEILKKVCGSYAKNVQFDTFTEKDKSAIRNDIAALDKVRLVVAQEGPEGARLDEGIVKQLTGQDEVTARFLHREFFTFTPKFKVLLVTNHKPTIAGTDNGIWRRVVLVPWPVTIPADKRDKKLTDKLTDELHGILAWCVKGYEMWREEGLGKLPTSLIIANDDYRKDADIVGIWIDECCDADLTATETTAELYASYEGWAKRSGHRPFSQKTLGDRLRERGLEQVRTATSRSWRGLRLKPPF